MRCATWFVISAAAMVVSTACRAQERAPSPPVEPAAKPQAAAKAQDEVVDKILTRLESRKIDDLHAKVTYESRYTLEEEKDAVKLLGEIWYRDEQPVAKFKIQFNAKINGNRKDKFNWLHVFDGHWYYELDDSKSKVISKREVRRVGDKSNPYKIGEGTFPIPFGQKKADILDEFDVTRVQAGEDDPENTDHLRLAPRTGTRTSEHYKRVEFWIAREGPQAGLPIKVRMAKRDPSTGEANSTITVTFSDVQMNAGISASIFNFEVPPGYEVDTETLDDVKAK